MHSSPVHDILGTPVRDVISTPAKHGTSPGANADLTVSMRTRSRASCNISTATCRMGTYISAADPGQCQKERRQKACAAVRESWQAASPWAGAGCRPDSSVHSQREKNIVLQCLPRECAKHCCMLPGGCCCRRSDLHRQFVLATGRGLSLIHISEPTRPY